MPVIALVPLPWRRPVRVEAPVPPPPTPRVPASVLVNVRVPLELVIVVEAVRPLNAVDDVARVTAPVRVLLGTEMEETPLLILEVAVHVGTPFRYARTYPAVPAVVVERADEPLPYGMALD